ncbi:protein neprosin-like [Alnus glutinosa]|uniref:protein neprosin-like n=1 Tax=Alnus glutinosa TaxID=3517 RepID=UPI002D78DA9D|nr:protein neprosin-like [Alnus glutinosa]
MVKRFIFIFLALNLLILCGGLDHAKAKARKSLSKVNRKLKLLNKPAVKSIKSEDGDIIDCIDIYKQPAFDHPALRNHTIQMKPNFSFPHESSSRKNESSSPAALSQTWQKTSGSCPEGTVPIRRIRRKDLLRAASLEHLGRDGPQTSSAANTTFDQSRRIVYLNDSKVQVYLFASHSNAFLITSGYNYIGARGDVNVWSPRVESRDDYTTGQIWLKHGLESVEAGWMVNPKLFGDTRPRLFGRWTLDGYQRTGCINHFCPGFIQTSKRFALGAVVEPWSQRRGPQYQISVRMDRDPDTGNWWLQVGDEVIGYWPGSILNYLRQSAIIVQWGGDVYSQKVKRSRPHTATAMGSGEWPSGLWGLASYINKVRIVDYSLQVKYPEWVHSYAEEPDCYAAYNYQKSLAFEPVFYFGGPGRNHYCYKMDSLLGTPSLGSDSCHLSSPLNTPVTPIKIEETQVTPIKIEDVETSAARSMPDRSQSKFTFEAGQGSNGNNLMIAKYSEKVIREALCEMIIVDEMPFMTLEGKGFQKLLRVLEPRFKVPSRYTVMKDCVKLYIRDKNILKNTFFTTGQRVCLTTDTWTSIQNMNYMCITGDFIDTNWKYHKRILAFRQVADHKGQTIARELEECLVE